jgi:hypothetical protein
MAKTYPKISFGLYGIESKQNSSFSTPANLQPFSKLIDLKTDNITPLPYATYEPDFWLLDGNYKLLPSNLDYVHPGLISLDMSDASGEFDTPIVLTIDFSQSFDTDGLSLRFSPYSGDYANLINVKYYLDAALLDDSNYAPNDTEYSIDNAVSGFNKIVITFYSTNRAYRYLRITGINFGKLISLEKDAIRAANVVEESDPLGAEIRINSLELRLWSEDEQFSILNPDGYYAALKERQPLAVYENVDGLQTFIGQFYLKTWQNLSENEIEFVCTDILGILDKTPYRGGLWSGSGIKVEDLIDDMLSAVYVPYELDPELFDIDIVGWIPAGTYREALQQIAFAIGASVDCSRAWTVKIYKTKIAEDSEATTTITKAEKAMGQPVSLRQLVTAVEVYGHEFVSSTDTAELYNGILSTGTHEIIFNQPMHDLSISGATITESGANYAIINVASTRTVVLSGQIYVDTKTLYKVETPGVSLVTQPNVLKVESPYLVNIDNLTEVAQRISDYYQQRYVQKVKLFAPSIEVGQVVEVETLYNRKIRGVVEKIDANLSGFVVKAEIVGVATL